MKYPYPKKAIIKSFSFYKDGGTEVFKVQNKEEMGINYIYKDGRTNSTSKGKFFTSYPREGSEEIIPDFLIIE
jgi:hypothetical protein